MEIEFFHLPSIVSRCAGICNNFKIFAIKNLDFLPCSKYRDILEKRKKSCVDPIYHEANVQVCYSGLFDIVQLILKNSGRGLRAMEISTIFHQAEWK